MPNPSQPQFPPPVACILDRHLPEPAMPVGYSALIHAYGLQVPAPIRLCAISERHTNLKTSDWRIFPNTYIPAATLEGHLMFALRHEGLDLAVLRRLFLATGAEAIAALIRAKPTGGYARRIWFLYEWLLGEQLDLADAFGLPYVTVVNVQQQYFAEDRRSTRHKVHNNLPGTPDFCPLIFKTARLERFLASHLRHKARQTVAAIPQDLMLRTAASLLLQDAKASYAIEGENPPRDRMQRWGQAIGEAGQHRLDIDELLRLQKLVIGDKRLMKFGLRDAGGFIGTHERDSQAVLPVHISARPEDLDSIVGGLIAFEQRDDKFLDPVLAAAVVAFGFVLAHPFEDGNGRIHRYLMQHVLTRRGFSPPGVSFPISSVILERMDDYKEVLESCSSRILPVVQWQATERNNVHVLNDTADYYRFFDATPCAEFLFACLQQTIEEEIPEEAEFLRCQDDFRQRVDAIAAMPDQLFELLLHFLQQNEGRFSKRARTNAFANFSNLEIKKIEAAYASVFYEWL